MGGSVKKILAVDDDVTVLQVLRRLLGEEYCLAEASTGEEALAVLASYVPHLVLLETRMPGIDGYETCRRIRCNPSSHRIQIAMLSARSSHEEVLRAYAAGADDYVVKPFDPHELCSRIRLHFRLCGVPDSDGLADGDGGSLIDATAFPNRCDADEPAIAIHRTVGIHPSAPAVRINRDELRFRFDSLHSREREAMAKIIDGMPNKTIARHLGVSLRTANRIRATLFEKMGVTSAVDLVKVVGRLQNDVVLERPEVDRPVQASRLLDSPAAFSPRPKVGRRLLVADASTISK